MANPWEGLIQPVSEPSSTWGGLLDAAKPKKSDWDGLVEAPSHKLFSSPTTVTQQFGNFNPEIEKYSGGTNLGTDFRAQENTPLMAPDGDWVVEKAKSGFNDGSGNVVKIKNAATGETLTLEHLNAIDVLEGQRLTGGESIGKTGKTGNVTGPHLSLPYQDESGKYQDVLNSPYKDYLPEIY